MDIDRHVKVDGRDVRLTNLDKVIWPDIGVTKAQLMEYHLKMSDLTLPYWRNRPMTITRYPKGVTETGFYQKNCPEYAPEWVETVIIPGDDKETEYILVNNSATLIWMANQSAIEFHPATYCDHAPKIPSFAVIDLDPTAPQGFDEAVEVALYTKVILEQLKLRGYPKTSGATGIHIYIPLQPSYTFSQTSRLVEFIGQLLINFYPKQVTNERLIKNRTGVYIDHLQNLANKTIAGVYSPRPLPGAPVSTPITWEELPSVHPGDFIIENVPNRIQQQGDLFAPVLTDLQNLSHILPMMNQI